jgi:hypothetical protein
MYPEIYANKTAGTVMAAMFGPRPELRFMNSNTLIPNVTTRQFVHKDIKDRHILSHPGGAVMNICLIDLSPETGSTELWLGTHTSSQWDDYEDPKTGQITDAKVEERRKVRPPVYPTVPRGSIVLRDYRLWYVHFSCVVWWLLG